MIIESYFKRLKNKIMRNLIFTGYFYGEKITIVQVQKRTAKKLFESGETIYLQSCNMQPFGVWSTCFGINKERADGDTFESIVNNFEYYNCDNERGLYTTFYKRMS